MREVESNWTVTELTLIISSTTLRPGRRPCHPAPGPSSNKNYLPQEIYQVSRLCVCIVTEHMYTYGVGALQDISELFPISSRSLVSQDLLVSAKHVPTCL